ncbi:MAG: hypothetical protein M1820_010327 [Bogoriella megaspora]|nr:MAG: hypothetical protein M1820_010327 [Bogoriella megaspora]
MEPKEGADIVLSTNPPVSASSPYMVSLLVAHVTKEQELFVHRIFKAFFLLSVPLWPYPYRTKNPHPQVYQTPSIYVTPRHHKMNTTLYQGFLDAISEKRSQSGIYALKELNSVNAYQTSMAKRVSSQSGLLCLPPEIRDIVYDNMIGGGITIKADLKASKISEQACNWTAIDSEDDPCLICSDFHGDGSCAWSPTSMNDQLRNELLFHAAFRQKISFIVDMDEIQKRDPNEYYFYWLNEFLRRCDPNTKALLVQNLRLKISFGARGSSSRIPRDLNPPAVVHSICKAAGVIESDVIELSLEMPNTRFLHDITKLLEFNSDAASNILRWPRFGESSVNFAWPDPRRLFLEPLKVGIKGITNRFETYIMMVASKGETLLRLGLEPRQKWQCVLDMEAVKLCCCPTFPRDRFCQTGCRFVTSTYILTRAANDPRVAPSRSMGSFKRSDYFNADDKNLDKAIEALMSSCSASYNSRETLREADLRLYATLLSSG